MEGEALQLASGPAPAVLRADRRLRLGDMLVRDGLLTPEQLREALAAKADNRHQRLGEIVVERGWVSSTDLAKALAEQHGLEFIELGQLTIDEAAADLLSERLAKRYRAVPVKFLAEDSALVAVADPTDVVSSDDLKLALGLNVRLAVAETGDLERTLARIYRTEVDVDETIPTDAEASAEVEDAEEDIKESAATSAPAIKLVNSVLSRAIEDDASDIHFEPEAKHLVVRARIDGVTRRLTTIPKQMQAAVISRLKIMGELDIAERRLPQDGRVSIRFAGQPMDLRIAVLPTTHGEKVILRIIGRLTEKLGLADLGMSPEAEEAFSRAIAQPFGAIISCGPTGSGKTTTLYAGLEILNEEERVIATIEDPVERQVPGIAQLEVSAKAGLTFGRGLRTMLRADPDVLLIGEIRDEETARIAIQAAMTGHLVLTTLHTYNAASAIARLKDMGVEANLLATSINCIVAQRLARRLCQKCREEYIAGHDELAELGLPDAGERVTLHKPVGCVDCAETGYRGRVALYEVLPVQGKVRSLIGGTTEEIFAAALEQGMKTLRDDGVRQALAGVTSLEEVRRVTGDRFS
jgi:type IV pilus assembly protein PilB